MSAGHQVDRRRFLRQVGVASGAGLLTCIAGQLAVHAAAPSQMDRCLVVNVHGNAWWPKLIRPLQMQSETVWTFADTLDPLAAYREQSLLLEGFYNPHGKGLHGNYGGVLCVMPAPEGTDNKGIGGISIDRKIAIELGADVPFSSVNFGHSYGRRQKPAMSNVSADGPSEPYPPFTDPVEIIDHFFGMAGNMSDPDALQRVAMKRSLLDAMNEDIGRMQTRLAGEERAIMDQYVSSVRELELQLDKLDQIVCTAPMYAGPEPGFDASIEPQLSKFYYDAAQAALACGLTRVVTIAHEGVGDEPLQPKYPFDPVNVPESLHDDIQHPMNGLKNDSDEKWAEQQANVEKVKRVYRWRSEQVTAFLDGLHTLDLGGATLGDRTLMLWINSGGGRHHQGSNEIPLMFIGNPDGVLNSGRYQRFENQQRCVSDAFVTLAHAMGVPLDSFGDPELSQGALPGLLA